MKGPRRCVLAIAIALMVVHVTGCSLLIATPKPNGGKCALEAGGTLVDGLMALGALNAAINEPVTLPYALLWSAAATYGVNAWHQCNKPIPSFKGAGRRGLKSRVQLESTPHHIPVSKRRAVPRVSLEEQCRNGDGTACGQLGMRYEEGDGVPRDPMTSHLLLSQACGMRDALSCQNLAVIYENGDGVAADSQRANLFYERACLLGGAEACSHLADNVTDGDGATRDPRRAAELYKKACQGGYSEACQWALDPGPAREQ